MKHPELATPVRRPLRFQPLRFQSLRSPWFGLMAGLLLMAVMATWTGLAHAADADDPPGRVGRLSELNGQVWVFDTEGNEWITASRNRPVTTGDRLSTEADGRAELRIGSTTLRVAPNTEIEVLRLDDDHVSLQLHSGSVSSRLRSREAADEFSLQTAEGQFRTERSGHYRFDRQDDTSAVTALSGQASYASEGTGLTVQQGQRVEFWKERGTPQYSVMEPRRDEFSNWVASLEGREERSVSTRYVSAEMTGVEDLDRYGRWEGETEYGAVWIPRTVAPGWAPYRMGHWAWIRPWGWTWVDDAPWGFAPFHYGRWVWYRNAWCWAPGRYVARPVYAPALVAWVGGPSVNVSVRVGGAPTVGWFPLGPREVYVPGYRVSPRYVQNVNVTHVTNITNVTTIINNPGQAMANARYVNRGQPRAVTMVPAQVVERRQPVAPSFSPVSERQLRDLDRVQPRPQAPVAAPRAPQARPVVDPRVSRPGGPRLAPPREAGGNAPPATVGSPRVQEPRPAPPNGNGRDDPRDNIRDGRDRRDRDGDGRPDIRPDAPTVRPAPAVPRETPQLPPSRVVETPRQEAPRVLPQPGQPAPVRPGVPVIRDGRGDADRDRERSPAPVREERERQRHNDIPQRQQVQIPQPQPQPRPQVQAPPPQVHAPVAPPQVSRPPAPPRPVVREAPPPQQQPEQRQQRGREERERGGNERGERGERR
jgi:hypothetical protein